MYQVDLSQGHEMSSDFIISRSVLIALKTLIRVNIKKALPLSAPPKNHVAGTITTHTEHRELSFLVSREQQIFGFFTFFP